jgi:hypothetical protein
MPFGKCITHIVAGNLTVKNSVVIDPWAGQTTAIGHCKTRQCPALIGQWTAQRQLSVIDQYRDLVVAYWTAQNRQSSCHWPIQTHGHRSLDSAKQSVFLSLASTNKWLSFIGKRKQKSSVVDQYKHVGVSHRTARKQSSQGVTKRCRLTWLTNSALVYEPNYRGWGVVVGSQPMSTALHRSPNKLWGSNSIFNI